MIFKCVNCGANTVWTPEKDRMCCPHCESLDSENLVTNDNAYQCIACGAPITPKQFDSATKCEHCGAYTIFDERIKNQYEPHLIIPFKIGKERAKEIIRNEFSKKLFVPTSFLKEAYLDKMEGIYVPFFLYDFDCNYRYTAKAYRVRRWTRGNVEYTETSIYQIYRTMNTLFSRVPADASIAMPDAEMDLLEPFDYMSMVQFAPKFMSGFLGEMYSVDGGTLEPRAKRKAKADAAALMQESISGYNRVVPEMDDCRLATRNCNYALLPVWTYDFSYRGKTYRFALNGETGKLIGKAPISFLKLMAYGTTVFASLSAIFIMLCQVIMGV